MSGRVRIATTLVAIVVVAMLAIVRAGSGPPVALDGSPRIPDTFGVVAAANERQIVLEDGRRFDIASDALLFSTYTAEPQRPRPGRLVHLGLADPETVNWVATIGTVAQLEPPAVLYTGIVVDVDDGAVTFADGTVLRVGPNLDASQLDGFVAVEIGPDTGFIVRVRPG